MAYEYMGKTEEIKSRNTVCIHCVYTHNKISPYSFTWHYYLFDLEIIIFLTRKIFFK